MANEKILIVDDDKNICELLRLYLEKEGYDHLAWPHDGQAGSSRPLPPTSPAWCCWTS